MINYLIRWKSITFPEKILENNHLNSQNRAVYQINQEESLFWRLKILIPLLVGYFLGSVLGTFCFNIYGEISFLFPPVFIGLNGVVFSISFSVLKRYYGTTVTKFREVSTIPLKKLNYIVNPKREIFIDFEEEEPDIEEETDIGNEAEEEQELEIENEKAEEFDKIQKTKYIP